MYVVMRYFNPSQYFLYIQDVHVVEGMTDVVDGVTYVVDGVTDVVDGVTDVVDEVKDVVDEEIYEYTCTILQHPPSHRQSKNQVNRSC